MAKSFQKDELCLTSPRTRIPCSICVIRISPIHLYTNIYSVYICMYKCILYTYTYNHTSSLYYGTSNLSWWVWMLNLSFSGIHHWFSRLFLQFARHECPSRGNQLWGSCYPNCSKRYDDRRHATPCVCWYKTALKLVHWVSIYRQPHVLPCRLVEPGTVITTRPYVIRYV